MLVDYELLPALWMHQAHNVHDFQAQLLLLHSDLPYSGKRKKRKKKGKKRSQWLSSQKSNWGNDCKPSGIFFLLTKIK